MTKLKNTKKGMAKKALSISLVAAMLATSNVPVWAAEDLFSDGSAAVEAPAVEEPAAEVDTFSAEPVEETVGTAQVQAATDYTVNTNVELKTKDGSWASALTLAKKEGVDGEATLTITKDGEEVTPSSMEVYYNNDLVGSAYTISDLASINTELNKLTPGVDTYKDGKLVEVKIYVAKEAQPVATFSYNVQAVNITGRDVGYEVSASTDDKQASYDGKVHYPTNVIVGSTAKQSEGKITVGYESVDAGINVGDYYFYAEGVEEEGYTGRTKLSTDVYTIEAATPTKDNLSVVVSGDVTYNGAAKNPASVVVTDKYTGTVLSEDLYRCTTSNSSVGSYEGKTITINLEVNNGKTGDEKIVNNFASGVIDTSIVTGSYKINALDLSQLSNTYNITINSKEKGDKVTFKDFTFVNKTTGKEVAVSDVLGDTQKTTEDTTSISNSLVKIITTNNAEAGNGTVTIVPATSGDTNVINSYTGTFRVAAKKIDGSLVEFPKGTKIGDTVLKANTALSNRAIVENELDDITYTGNAIEPLKEAFSNLVWKAKSPSGADIKLELGKDYNLIYSNNTDSEDVSGDKATITLQFIGEYTGEIVYKFKINKATADVIGEEIPYEAGKSSYDVKAKVVFEGTETPVPTSDYTVKTTKKATKVGEIAEGTVTFVNKNFTNTTNNITSEVKGKSLTDDSISANVVGSYVYTGTTINPTIEVKDGSTVLTEGIDYKIVNKSGTDAGDAFVVIQGINNFSDQLTLKYTIAKAELKDTVLVSSKDASKDSSLSSNYNQTYNGQVQGPDIATIKIGNTELKPYDEDQKTGDYILTYDENAKAVGTYNYTITAAPTSTKVQGSITGTYQITAGKLTAQFVKKNGGKFDEDEAKEPTEMTPEVAYTGSAITLEDLKTRYILVDKNNNELKEGVDYRLVYENNTDAGQATVYAYGLGNYAYTENGKEVAIATANFIIEGSGTIEVADITAIADAEYAGGLYVEPKVTVKVDKKTLVQGVDYTVTTTAIEVGKDYTGSVVTIKGKGAYTAGDEKNMGVQADSNLKWDVVKKDIKNTKISVKDDVVTVLNGNVIVPETEYTVEFNEDGTKATVTAKEDSKNYTGSQEVSVTDTTVGAPTITDVTVIGNKVTVILDGEADEAVGYDYVISTENDYTNGRLSNGINKNQLTTQTTYQYIQKGTYYAYCHAWKRDENGNKVFGAWSNIYQFTVGATTPNQPSITKIEKSSNGKHLRITWTKSANAIGYDVVMGTKLQKVNGEYRPVEYGKAVKKVTNGNTVSVIFYNIPKGTYYVGLHAYNRSSLEGTKVFSPWSNSVKVTF